jgi:hypothetical protein
VLAFSAGGELLIHEGIDVRLLDRQTFQPNRANSSGRIIFFPSRAASDDDAQRLTQARVESRPRAVRLRGPDLSRVTIRALSVA